ncbi:hypothetical protein LshimejAT787_1204630 [Lyophyllum shimeji]|uniref:Uncharacterized protein n=1 Tax=Lyophyllum shimeji TaxID=47721 RepID=A0A9P3UPP7_LYOSH|nr:hypothetical protein LshimejAT787_1204630 [Lyophyllum shimeji]
MSDDAPSTRKRTTSGSSTATANNLPPPRTSKGLKSVSAPLTHTRLNRLIYLLAFLTTLLVAYYSYRVVQYKSEVGGWWNLALGRPPPLQTEEGGNGFSRGKGRPRKEKAKGEEESVEDRINALARALGMPSKELASAIAVAVRDYVPPASLSSVAARETGPAVQAMVRGVTYEPVKVEGTATESQTQGMFGSVVSGMENLVGMDEP